MENNFSPEEQEYIRVAIANYLEGVFDNIADDSSDEAAETRIEEMKKTEVPYFTAEGQLVFRADAEYWGNEVIKYHLEDPTGPQEEVLFPSLLLRVQEVMTKTLESL